jgi:hypothetical protein
VAGRRVRCHQSLRDQELAVGCESEVVDLARIRHQRDDFDGLIRPGNLRFSQRRADREECQQPEGEDSETRAHALSP